MRGLPQFRFSVHPRFLSVRLLERKHPSSKCHLFKHEAQSCCQLMSAFCQVSLARQQSINCLQLAEFPPLSCSCGQSGARSVERRRLAVATAPLPLVYAPHTLFAAVVRLLKLHAKVKHNLLLLSRMSGVLTEQSPFGIFWVLFPGRSRPSIKREMGESISEMRSWAYCWGGGCKRAGCESGVWCEVVSCASSRCLWVSVVIFELQNRCGGTQLKNKRGWGRVFECSQGKRQTAFIWLTLPRPHRLTSVHRNKQALGCSPGGPPLKRPAWHRAACVYSPPALKCLCFHQGLWETEAMFRG